MKTIHLWRVLVGIMLVIVVGNVVFIDWIWLKDRGRLDGIVKQMNQLTTAFAGIGGKLSDMNDRELDDLLNPVAVGDSDSIESECGTGCQEEISRKVTEVLVALDLPTSSTVVSIPQLTTVVNSRSGIYYVPLSGTGSTSSRDWVSIPTTETVIDWSDYGSSPDVTWDAYAKVFQGNGKVMLRLYDKTNAVEVPGSNLESGSEISVHLVSSPLTVWAGKNTYIVQVKTLTGYEGFFESGRIKVMVK